jgi:hypothetical protein
MDDKDLYIGLPVPEQLKDAGAGGEAGSGGGFAFLEEELRFTVVAAPSY